MIETNKKMSRPPVNLYIEANPNPNSLKFVANFMLVPEGKSFDFPDVESAGSSPLARELFAFDYVERVFYMNNFVTVTKSEQVDWTEVRGQIKTCIKDYLDSGKDVFDETAIEEIIEEGDPELIARIKGVLDEYVKPAVEQDGGAIVFKDFREGTVNVSLQGSCNGCPSSTITLKAGIENILTTMIPEVKKVEAAGE